jgi:hypothetical protein
MSRPSTVLVLLVATTLGLAGCFTPRVNINVDKGAVGEAKQMVSRLARDGGTDDGKSRRE